MAIWDLPNLSETFAKLVNDAASDVNAWAHRHGFYDGPPASEVMAKVVEIENNAGMTLPVPIREAVVAILGSYKPNHAESVALIHSELSEALEYLRKPDAVDDHLPDEDPVGLEMADTVIRILNYCGYHKIPIGELIIKKCRYNDTRPRRNGGKAF